MKLIATCEPLHLKFKKPAGTSRGVLTGKTSWIIKLYDAANPHICGVGECAPLPGLSTDLRVEGEFGGHVQAICALVNGQEIDTDALFKDRKIDNISLGNVYSLVMTWVKNESLCSIIFGLETALIDLLMGGQRMLFNNSFARGKDRIAINGLIWMAPWQDMKQQIEEKLAEGYTCIKIKIGALDFEEEYAVLKWLRAQFTEEQLTIRVDANGAWQPGIAAPYLERLAELAIHSIEQPWFGEYDYIASLPIPIALDEDLINTPCQQVQNLVKSSGASYLVLKPTLLGGLYQTSQFIKAAESAGAGWWITSALESNIGLNAIAQLAGQYHLAIPQGLGTGKLFENNIESPLYTEGGYLHYDPDKVWGV